MELAALPAFLAKFVPVALAVGLLIEFLFKKLSFMDRFLYRLDPVTQARKSTNALVVLPFIIAGVLCFCFNALGSAGRGEAVMGTIFGGGLAGTVYDLWHNKVEAKKAESNPVQPEVKP